MFMKNQIIFSKRLKDATCRKKSPKSLYAIKREIYYFDINFSKALKSIKKSQETAIQLSQKENICKNFKNFQKKIVFINKIPFLKIQKNPKKTTISKIKEKIIKTKIKKIKIQKKLPLYQEIVKNIQSEAEPKKTENNIQRLYILEFQEDFKELNFHDKIDLINHYKNTANFIKILSIKPEILHDKNQNLICLK